ncbi:hypothetical protein [Alkalihalobacillus sp. BA299]|uniref:hypothetical protein n=1 Tax=Alkalihalobacillus sp. BA299 TaxID=2815938 RepID=UPI001ADB1040|nr:hypothetical protein [Alkalihalobacillus sp. BA299]
MLSKKGKLERILTAFIHLQFLGRYKVEKGQTTGICSNFCTNVCQTLFPFQFNQCFNDCISCQQKLVYETDEELLDEDEK